MARDLFQSRENQRSNIQTEKERRQNKNRTHKSHQILRPENSDSDKDTSISNEEDEEAETQPTQPTGPTTRSRDNTLPPPINRFTAIVNTQQDEVTQIARQPPMKLTSLWGSNNTQFNNATFPTEFRTLFAQNHTNSAP